MALRVLEHGRYVPDVSKLKVGSLGYICYLVVPMSIAERHGKHLRYKTKAYFAHVGGAMFGGAPTLCRICRQAL